MPRGIPKNPALSKQAKHTPVIKSGAFDSQDTDVGQIEARVQSDKGLEKSVIARTNDIDMDSEKVQMLAFMNERVVVRIATTTDKNAEQVFEINVNSHNEFFRRGDVKTVPRFIADRMARLKVTTYTQRECMNSEGIKQILNEPHTGLKYDFSIDSDPNPIGKHWFRAVMAEPG